MYTPVPPHFIYCSRHFVWYDMPAWIWVEIDHKHDLYVYLKGREDLCFRYTFASFVGRYSLLSHTLAFAHKCHPLNGTLHPTSSFIKRYCLSSVWFIDTVILMKMFKSWSHISNESHHPCRLPTKWLALLFIWPQGLRLGMVEMTKAGPKSFNTAFQLWKMMMDNIESN